MNLSNYYWYFTSALTPRFCDQVIAYATSKQQQLARTGGFDKSKLTKQDYLDLKRKRNSDLVWLSEPWIYRELHPYIEMANKNAGWNFEWSKSEACQFTYYKLNQFYDWHCDSWEHPYKDGDNIGMTRKLSMTCQLTDGSEYEGGELEFDFRNYDPHMRDESRHLKQAKEILPKGSIIVFPSFVWHRVKPVTAGTRYSLVVWNLGKPFK